MEKLDCGYFEWTLWREGSPLDLFLVCREIELIRMRKTIMRHAVGWCNAEHLLCRPKTKHKAVMFFKGGRHFWFHLTNSEFERIFSDE
jgi:hypothetical protein